METNDTLNTSRRGFLTAASASAAAALFASQNLAAEGVWSEPDRTASAFGIPDESPDDR